MLSPSTAPVQADSIRRGSDNSPRPARTDARTSRDSPGKGTPRDSKVNMTMTAKAPYSWTKGSKSPRKCSIPPIDVCPRPWKLGPLIQAPPSSRIAPCLSWTASAGERKGLWDAGQGRLDGCCDLFGKYAAPLFIEMHVLR